jgi:hypothetical protein
MPTGLLSAVCLIAAATMQAQNFEAIPADRAQQYTVDLARRYYATPAEEQAAVERIDASSPSSRLAPDS